MKKAMMVLFLVLATASWGSAADEQPSLKRGEELFNSTQLGTSGKSCASCHPGGKKLEAAAGYKDDKLAAIINRCIMKPLKGKPLAADSTDLRSLIIYLKSFASATTSPSQR